MVLSFPIPCGINLTKSVWTKSKILPDNDEENFIFISSKKLILARASLCSLSFIIERDAKLLLHLEILYLKRVFPQPPTVASPSYQPSRFAHSLKVEYFQNSSSWWPANKCAPRIATFHRAQSPLPGLDHLVINFRLKCLTFKDLNLFAMFWTPYHDTDDIAVLEYVSSISAIAVALW